jgi:adenylosuccinate synthase
MVRRDASHNVKFMVQSPMVKFIPLDSGFIEEFLQYTVPSGTLVSKHQLENLFKQIQDQGFFDLNANYKSNIDDNSML